VEEDTHHEEPQNSQQTKSDTRFSVLEEEIRKLRQKVAEQALELEIMKEKE
jgi:hypothetical protein